MTYQTGESPDIDTGEQYPDFRKGYGPEGHHVVRTRRSGPDSWVLVCECGRRWRSWRWHCEESYSEHLPMDEPKEKPPLWWDDASYLRYQSMP